eukprot:3404788-Rhodomonas_salina.1
MEIAIARGGGGGCCEEETARAIGARVSAGESIRSCAGRSREGRGCTCVEDKRQVAPAAVRHRLRAVSRSKTACVT